MSTAAPPMPPDLADRPPCPVHRLSVEEFLRVVESGAVEDAEGLEPLEGWMTLDMPRDPRHEVGTTLAMGALFGLGPAGWHLRVQASSRTADSVPEPDLSIVRGVARDYLGRHPGPEDTALVVEVSDSSLAQDRTLKARIYARAGIPAYWIVNLVEGLVEVHGDPTGPAAEPSRRTEPGARPAPATRSPW